MELPLSRFRDITLDQIQSGIINFPSFLLPPKVSKSKKLSFFPFKLRTTQFSLIKCSSNDIEEGLRPRPKPKPKQNSENLDNSHEEIVVKKPKMRISPTGLCLEIERLVRFKRYQDAFELFEILECEGDYDVGDTTYEALVNACVELKSIRGVKRVYKYMVNSGYEPDLYMSNRILAMHVECRMMMDAKRLFGEMPVRNVVSWNTIILGLVDSGDYEVAFDLFKFMWSEFSDASPHSFTTMLRASAGLGCGYVGRQLHSNALKLGLDENTHVSCGLINMYSKCGSLVDARRAFDEIPEKTVVGWNTIIAGYAAHGYSDEALSLHHEMQDSGVKMDHFTYSMIITVCARLASVEHAKQAHAGLVRNGFGSDLEANTALIDFYGKWGKIEDALHVFNKMPRKNVTTWNAMIAGYSHHGKGIEAVLMLERMVREGLTPNHVTFLVVLSACAHSGLSDKGWDIFESMSREYKVKPRAMHYACMIQLLGREGYLDEALAMIRDAPFRPTENMWGALLNACRIHNNLELGKLAAERLYGMKPEMLSNYVVLLNIYNSSGRLEEAAEVVQTLKRRGLKMLPACSWIEVKKQPHCFHSGDRSHPQAEMIYQELGKLMQEIIKHGYAPGDKLPLPDVDKEEERISYYHSEKLAIAFGLINTSASTSLQVVQSHRICSDCHNVIKLIALIAGREIVVKDATRFHHFKDGNCSCGDYW
ncbi:hypothetical protein ACHQM5_003778 [Ranunculus cassubicifolius]